MANAALLSSRHHAGFEHQEPVHSSDDAADTDDAAVALAMLGRDAAQQIRAQARPSETLLHKCTIQPGCASLKC